MSITVPNSTQYDNYLCLFTDNESDKRSRLFLSELKHQAKASITRNGRNRFIRQDLDMINWDSKTAMYFRNKYGLQDNDVHVSWYSFLVNFIFSRAGMTLNNPAPGLPPSQKSPQILNVIRNLANTSPGSVDDLVATLISEKLMYTISDANGLPLKNNRTDWGRAADFQFNDRANLIINDLIGLNITNLDTRTRLEHGVQVFNHMFTNVPLTANNLLAWLNTNIGAGAGANTLVERLINFFSISQAGVKPNYLTNWNQIATIGGQPGIQASNDPALIAQNNPQMWILVRALFRNYGAVAAAGPTPRQMEIFNLINNIVSKFIELFNETSFGYNYDKFLINTMLMTAVNNVNIPTSASNNLTDFSDVQDNNQSNEKYVRRLDGLLYEVKSDGSYELVEANSAAVQNLKEADKCIGTGFESHPGSTKTCYEYLEECIKGGDVDQCKIYLRDHNFWQNAAKEVDKMQPIVAYQTLKSFEFGRVQQQLGNRQIDRVQTWAEWLDSIKTKLTPQELIAISTNIKLQEYLNLIVKKVNDNPAILNKDYIGEKNQSVIAPDLSSVLGKYGLLFAPDVPSNMSTVVRLKQLSENSSRQVGLTIGIPGILPTARILVGGSNSYSEQYLQDTLRQQNSLVLGMYKSLKDRLVKMGKNINSKDDSLIMQLIEELKLKERKLHKIIVMTERYTELLRGHGVQDPNSSLTTDHLEKFVEQRNNYFKKVQSKQTNLVSIIQSIADSVQSLVTNVKPSAPSRSIPLGNF